LLAPSPRVPAASRAKFLTATTEFLLKTIVLCTSSVRTEEEHLGWRPDDKDIIKGCLEERVESTPALSMDGKVASHNINSTSRDGLLRDLIQG
jgi:hypothetical protein